MTNPVASLAIVAIVILGAIIAGIRSRYPRDGDSEVR